MTEAGEGGAQALDPKGLVRESFRIEGITAAECRSIFLDWALSLPDGAEAAGAARALIAAYGPDHAGHPMLAVLSEGAAAPPERPVRRGGSRARPRD